MRIIPPERALPEPMTDTIKPVMNVEEFPEVYAVNMRSWQFFREYLKVCFDYPFHFFRKAPLSHWHRFFISTHNVAKSCAVAKCALRAQDSIWTESALRQRLLKFGRSKLEQLRRKTPDTPPRHEDNHIQ